MIEFKTPNQPNPLTLQEHIQHLTHDEVMTREIAEVLHAHAVVIGNNNSAPEDICQDTWAEVEKFYQQTHKK